MVEFKGTPLVDPMQIYEFIIYGFRSWRGDLIIAILSNWLTFSLNGKPSRLAPAIPSLAHKHLLCYIV